ncbi:unnamed protein product [Hymenolepis diminuta]|uniref:Uncharacterized protein n=1 Tax=Hymenolepis diminuta TaxID=6216 RepID=A0A564Z2N4_HYMDI|nr:unnamed protein product [Hymenolepis diminuta]
MSPDISNLSITTGSPYSVKTSQSPVVSISPKLPPTATFIEAAYDDVKLHSSIGDSVKLMNLTHFMENHSSTTCLRDCHIEQQLVPTSCLLDHQINQIFQLK